ncbi:MAG: phosphotransferase [Bacteroidales bacterium]|nr:phosphotransferase [Bacteroidales bacterium]
MADCPQILRTLFQSYAGAEPEAVAALPASASNRRYYRLSGGGKTLIAVVGTSREENRAFVTIARHFRSKGLNVPQVYAESEDGMAYLQEDLGGDVLFDKVAKGRESGNYSSEEIALLKRTVSELPRLQVKGGEGLPWSVCYPQEAFDARMVDFDLNYFKYCYLKATGLEFNENRLQDDFEAFKADLLEETGETFLYRDFQARNVMIREGEPWFIDFQGGRRGPVYYDLASFVWQARSRFPKALKEELIATYLQALKAFRPVDEKEFARRLRLFVLFRTLQVLAAYGFRGYYERKTAFIESIPFALENLRELLQEPFTAYPYLNEVLTALAQLPSAEARSGAASAASSPRPETAESDAPLTVTVYSFSYKKGIPVDESGNGGGYVFDCRAVHNPGRYEQYKNLCGADEPVIRFLEDNGEIFTFLESAYKLVDAHVERYLQRGFNHLQVSFGCTGGQHRSMYSAEHMAAHLKEKFPSVRVVLRHRERGIEKVL